MPIESDVTMSKVTKAQAAERAEYKARFLSGDDGWAVAPGQTIYCLTSRVSRSGMARTIRLFVTNPPDTDGRFYGDVVGLPSDWPRYSNGARHPYEHGPRNLGGISDCTYMVAKILGEKVNQTHGGITMGGCGYDTHHALVDSLARALGIPLRYRSL